MPQKLETSFYTYETYFFLETVSFILTRVNVRTNSALSFEKT